MEEHNSYLNKDMFYSKMTAEQRRKNADTYAAFALEALHGTNVLKGWRNNPAGEFDRPPFVEFKGVLFGGEIRPTTS